MKKIYFFTGLMLFSALLQAQWSQNKGVTGGSIIKDIISFQNKIYIAVEDNGLYCSSDNGDNWAKVMIDHNWSIDRLEIHKNALLAATTGYIFKSEDGINWDKIEAPGIFVSKIQSDGENLYLATLINGIFKSEDDGTSWISINDETTSNGIESFHKAGNILYAGKYSDLGLVYKSSDEGLNWQQIFIGENRPIKEIHSNSRGLYINLGEKIIFSNDNGATWSNISGALGGLSIYNFSIKEEIIYANANGRFFYSSDNGGNWQQSEKTFLGYGCSSLYINDQNIFVGTRGGGIARNTLGIDEDWSAKNYGLFLNTIHQIASLNNTIFIGAEYSFIKMSVDQGQTWSQEIDQYNNKGMHARSMVVFKDKVYVGGDGGIFTKSENGSWGNISGELPNQVIESMCANKDYLFVAILNEGVFRSENPEGMWIKKQADLPVSIRGLYSFGNYIFMATWDGLFASTDNGDTWKDISITLPDRSINSLVLLDSTLIVATQYEGAFRANINDENWEKISGESITYLGLKNRTIFKCSSPGNLSLSFDLGDTWKLVSNGLPTEAFITTLGFSTDYIFAGFGRPGQGIWQRYNHEIMPPTIFDITKENDDQFIRINESIVMASDQQLMDDEGNPINSLSLQPYIRVFNSKMEEVGFSADIDPTSTIIEVKIINPTDGESYAVQIKPLANQSNLRSDLFTSRTYTYLKNKPPLLNLITKHAFVNSEIVISKNDILTSIVDEENDPISILHIISTPKNGTLKMNGSLLENETFIAADDLVDFIYTPGLDFIGNDTIKWNAFDGFDYSEQNSNIVLKIDAITGLTTEVVKHITVYPNPSPNVVTVSLNNDEIGTINYILTGIDGRILDKSSINKDSKVFEHTVSLEGFVPGVYLLKYSGKSISQSLRVIKQ